MNRPVVIVGVMLLVASAGVATGCGSTKVVSADKSLEYQGSIYNVSDVKQLSTRMEAVPASGETISLLGYDRKKFDALAKEKGPMTVRSLIALDQTVIVFQEKQNTSGRDYDRMQHDIKEVYKDLSRFMADPKKTQLKL